MVVAGAERSCSGVATSLPRSYTHMEIERVDVIEGFSSRMKSKFLNYQAWELAKQFGLPLSAGSDVSGASEIRDRGPSAYWDNSVYLA